MELGVLNINPPIRMTPFPSGHLDREDDILQDNHLFVQAGNFLGRSYCLQVANIIDCL